MMQKALLQSILQSLQMFAPVCIVVGSEHGCYAAILIGWTTGNNCLSCTSS